MIMINPDNELNRGETNNVGSMTGNIPEPPHNPSPCLKGHYNTVWGFWFIAQIVTIPVYKVCIMKFITN
jgi:hypothetical protein